MSLSFEDVRAWDAADPLRTFRDRFVLPAGVIYLDGNSLGALPAATAPRLAAVATAEWGEGLIRSWNARDWIGAPARVGAKIARLIGAGPHEAVVADPTSVNLYKLIAGGRPPAGGTHRDPGRARQLPDRPLRRPGRRRERSRKPALRVLPIDQLVDAIDADTALVMLTHVHYKTGAMHDMAAITRRAQAAGALMLWDLSHSAGAVEVDLNGAGCAGNPRPSAAATSTSTAALAPQRSCSSPSATRRRCNRR